MTDSTLLAGGIAYSSVITNVYAAACTYSLQPNHALSTNHTFIQWLNTWPDIYGNGEHMLGRIIAYNSKKNDKRQVNKRFMKIEV